MASSSLSNDASSSHDEQQQQQQQPPCPHIKDSATFFRIGNSRQFDHVLQLYPQAIRVKAEKRSKKPEKLIRLDDWFQNELPKLIKKRGKDAHLNHEELVQCMEWKQSRGKNYPQLSYLIKVNTPRAVMMETRKAFKKLPNIEQAIIALSNLKGVGTTMASALLAAACPERAPFMADECLMAIPEIEGIDYTTKEYLNFVQHIQSTVDRLNGEHAKAEAAAAAAQAAAAETTDEEEKQKKSLETAEPETTKPDDEEEEEKTSKNNNSTDEEESQDGRRNGSSNNNKSVVISAAAAARNAASEAAKEAALLKWSPHTVELALWTHYIASELQPELLKDLPGSETASAVLSSNNKFQQNGAIDQDEETIPDGTEALTSNRVTALINSGQLEEGSSSHDDEGASRELMKLNGDDLTDGVSAGPGVTGVEANGGSATVGIELGGIDVQAVAVATAVPVTEAAAAGQQQQQGAVVVVGESGENSSDTGNGTMTTMVNNVSSSESKEEEEDEEEEEEEEGSSQDEEAFKFKQNGGNNGDLSSTTTSQGTKRFSAEPLANVIAKCPKLLLDR